MKNLSNFQMACVVCAIPINAIVLIFSCFATIATMANRDWSFGYFIVSAVYAGMNLVSAFSSIRD